MILPKGAQKHDRDCIQQQPGVPSVKNQEYHILVLKKKKVTPFLRCDLYPKVLLPTYFLN